MLHSALKKGEIRFNQHRLYFDQDYLAEIQKKRRANAPIRKLLKKEGIRFQALPLARLRVLVDSGLIIYNSATEAMEDVMKRGLALAGATREVTSAVSPI